MIVLPMTVKHVITAATSTLTGNAVTVICQVQTGNPHDHGSHIALEMVAVRV